MEKSLILPSVTPYYSALVQLVQDSFTDFEYYIPEEVRPSLLKAHAKITSCRMIHRAQMMFGHDPKADAFMMNLNGLDVLIVRNDQQDVGIRLKKYDGGYKTQNHTSEQQDELRKSGEFSNTLFPNLDNSLAHVFLGYRSTGGVQPKLKDVAISFERMSRDGYVSVAWHHVIWSGKDGFDPRQTFTDPLPLPTDTWEVKPKGRGTGTDSAAETA